MDFYLKFEIVYLSIKHGLLHFTRENLLFDSLIDIITDIWTQDISESGYDSLYEYIRYNSHPPLQEWSLLELFEQLIDEKSDYLSHNNDFDYTESGSLTNLASILDQSFTSLDFLNLLSQLTQLNLITLDENNYPS